jgi:hypothetical protein
MKKPDTYTYSNICLGKLFEVSVIYSLIYNIKRSFKFILFQFKLKVLLVKILLALLLDDLQQK